MQEVRCEKCNKLLYRIDVPMRMITGECGTEVKISKITPQHMGTIECKCPRCGTININN